MEPSQGDPIRARESGKLMAFAWESSVFSKLSAIPAPDYGLSDLRDQRYYGNNDEAAIAHTGTFDEDADYLGDIRGLKRNLNSGANRSYFGRLDDNRPIMIKLPSYKGHANQLANERAALMVGRTIGIPMPHVVARTLPGYGNVLVMPKLRDVRPINDFLEAPELNLLPEDYHDFNNKIALFDRLITNHDRNGGNILLDRDFNPWAIDHGAAFDGNWQEWDPHDRYYSSLPMFFNRMRGNVFFEDPHPDDRPDPQRVLRENPGLLDRLGDLDLMSTGISRRSYNRYLHMLQHFANHI